MPRDPAVWHADDADNGGDYFEGGGAVLWQAEDFEDENEQWNGGDNSGEAESSFSRINPTGVMPTVVMMDCSPSSLSSHVSEDDFFQGFEDKMAVCVCKILDDAEEELYAHAEIPFTKQFVQPEQPKPQNEVSRPRYEQPQSWHASPDFKVWAAAFPALRLRGNQLLSPAEEIGPIPVLEPEDIRSSIILKTNHVDVGDQGGAKITSALEEWQREQVRRESNWQPLEVVGLSAPPRVQPADGADEVILAQHGTCEDIVSIHQEDLLANTLAADHQQSVTQQPLPPVSPSRAALHDTVVHVSALVWLQLVPSFRPSLQKVVNTLEAESTGRVAC
jgi:hypothetical protein